MFFIIRVRRLGSRTRHTMYVTKEQIESIRIKMIRHGFSIISVNPCSLSFLYSLHKKNNNIAKSYFKSLRMNVKIRNNTVSV